MKRYLICLLSLLLLSGASTATFAKGRKSKKKAQTTTAAAPVKKQSEYDKLFKDKKVKTSKGGIMTLHIVDDKLLVELPLKMLNRDMMLMSSVAEITDHTDSYVGLSPLRPLQVKFDTINRTVLLRRDRSQSVWPTTARRSAAPWPRATCRRSSGRTRSKPSTPTPRPSCST